MATHATTATDPYRVTPLVAQVAELADLSVARQIQAGHINAHHAAESLYAARAKLANDMHLTPLQKRNISPYPASPTNIVHYHQDQATALLVDKLLDRLAPVAPVAEKPAATPPPAPGAAATNSAPPTSTANTGRKWWPVVASLLLGSVVAGGSALWWGLAAPAVPPLGPVESEIGVTIR